MQLRDSVITATPLRGLLSSSRCRDAVTLRRCHAAGVSSRLRDFATLRRCHAAGVSSRLRDAATLPRRWGAARVFASLRCRGAAMLRRRWRGCSLLRSGAMLRRRERRCGGLLASSRLRVFGMKSWNPPCTLNATTYKLSVLFLYYIVPGAAIHYTYVLLSAYLPIPTYKPCKRCVSDM